MRRHQISTQSDPQRATRMKRPAAPVSAARLDPMNWRPHPLYRSSVVRCYHLRSPAPPQALARTHTHIKALCTEEDYTMAAADTPNQINRHVTTWTLAGYVSSRSSFFTSRDSRMDSGRPRPRRNCTPPRSASHSYGHVARELRSLDGNAAQKHADVVRARVARHPLARG